MQVARFERALAHGAATPVSTRSCCTSPRPRRSALPESRLDLVRLGMAIYGLAVDGDLPPSSVGLRPAMELAATVASVKRVPAGAGSRYGYDYRTSRRRRSRSCRSATPTAFRGTRRARAGLDQRRAIRDRGPHRDGPVRRRRRRRPVRVGDRAVLFGDPRTGAPTASDWAAAAGTINYEIVTRIGPRVPRRYVP